MRACALHKLLVFVYFPLLVICHLWYEVFIVCLMLELISDSFFTLTCFLCLFSFCSSLPVCVSLHHYLMCVCVCVCGRVRVGTRVAARGQTSRPSVNPSRYCTSRPPHWIDIMQKPFSLAVSRARTGRLKSIELSLKHTT